jgi:hypothetical protein
MALLTEDNHIKSLETLDNQGRMVIAGESGTLINTLFSHPYTNIEFVMRDLKVSRITAAKYLELLTKGCFLKKEKMGRANYFVNNALFGILTKDEVGK